MLYGSDLKIFTDRDIEWGDNWRLRLGQELGSATFMIAAVTPSYLKSDACRGEVLEFAATAAKTGSPGLLLPLIWVDIERSAGVSSEDPVRERILASQCIDVTAARRLDRASVEYEELVESIAIRLRGTIDMWLAAGHTARSSVTVSAPNASGEAATQGTSLIDSLQAIEDLQSELETRAEVFGRAFQDVGAAFSAEQFPQSAGAAGAAAAFERLGARLAEPNTHLERATRGLSEVWGRFDTHISAIIENTAGLPDELLGPLRDGLSGLASSLQLQGLEQVQPLLAMMAAFSKDLRPVASTLEESVRLISGIQAAVEAWSKALNHRQ